MTATDPPPARRVTGRSRGNPAAAITGGGTEPRQVTAGHLGPVTDPDAELHAIAAPGQSARERDPGWRGWPHRRARPTGWCFPQREADLRGRRETRLPGTCRRSRERSRPSTRRQSPAARREAIPHDQGSHARLRAGPGHRRHAAQHPGQPIPGSVQAWARTSQKSWIAPAGATTPIEPAARAGFGRNGMRSCPPSRHATSSPGRTSGPAGGQPGAAVRPQPARAYPRRLES